MSAATTTETAEPAWLRERRERARRLVGELALPGQKTKGWEFTDLSALDLGAYEPAAGGDGAAAELAAPILTAPEGSIALRQVDGLVAGGGSAEDEAGERAGEGGERAGEGGERAGEGGERPSEPVVMPLSIAAASYPELVGEHLGSLVPGEDVFVARNDAGWSGGAFVYVPAGKRLEAPADLSAIQALAGGSLEWRVLIVLEEQAEAEVWEQHLCADPGIDALFNAVVEIVVGPAARLRYVSGQALSTKSWSFATQRARVDRDGSLEWVALGFGSGRGKSRMETHLVGEGSSAKVTGAYAGNGTQHLDFDTTQEHAAAHTNSDLAFRGVLGERATAVWSGMIRVDPGAQQTDAFQESRNLLLSTDAHADAIPGLEIEADDVRCTHAAAVAQVDRDQLFYLLARGLAETDAKRLIIEGFLAELVERVPEGAVREELGEALERRLGELLDSD